MKTLNDYNDSAQKTPAVRRNVRVMNAPITIPRHEPIKKVYVEMVKQIVESEAVNDENAE